MSSPDIGISRLVLMESHKRVKTLFPTINLRKDAWVWCAGRGRWEFHGPDQYYWNCRASNAYDARAKGWDAWLRSQGHDD
jgi:hypothetical protein